MILARTGELDAEQLGEIRALLGAVFDDLTEEDVEHAMGGVHAMVREDGRLVAHASVVERRLVHRDRELRCGYVEAVATLPTHRRRGHGRAVMRALERVIAERFDLGALATTDEGEPFYRALGWQQWRGPTFAGDRRTPDEDGGVFVLPVRAELDLDGPLSCDERAGDPW